MKIILLSGGSGKRLWPLSNDSRSKQFLKVLPGVSGERESMVQRVWRQLGEAQLQNRVVIATGKAQEGILRNQLGADVPLIIEPERRDTFPAIALATSYLYSMQNVAQNETIVVLPVDPYVNVEYFQDIKNLDGVLRRSGADLCLMGVKPTYPSEKYGYIVPKAGASEDHQYEIVSHFKEKPDVSLARKLIKNHALWNCGVFAFSMEFLLKIIEGIGCPISYDMLYKRYIHLPRISFDYEVVEKAANIVVVKHDGQWRDLGTWNTLTDEMSSKILGKGIVSEDSLNTHIVNELDVPVAVLGISNAVVAASPDGILVADKKASPKVKEIINFEQRPMYEERNWGWYKVLDYTKLGEGNEMLTKRIRISAGKNISYHKHSLRSEVWTILQGEGEIIINGTVRRVGEDDVIVIPIGTQHGIKAKTDLELIEIQKGTEIAEEDIERVIMTWEQLVALGQSCP